MPDNSVKVFNPTGDLVDIPQEQLGDALNQGYQQASPQEVQDAQLQDTYGTPRHS